MYGESEHKTFFDHEAMNCYATILWFVIEVYAHHGRLESLLTATDRQIRF